ncbi:Zinc finger protein 226 like protein [Argiope bruennichi]|uniref:Zinc finger protein 226 like protein n=1 Tax=Argiope bruennichi TaxID=94029 RepID=A0A8T0E573_ARGBR|nr:Zinc finger protein 226 like protein [Argiope bruennichi]
MKMSRYQCDCCQLILTSEAAYRNHQTTHSEYLSRCFKCSFCPYSTDITNWLKLHGVIHSGERLYKYSMCSKSVAWMDILKRLILACAGEKPYKCCMCSKSFRLDSALSIHIKKPLNIYPYMCHFYAEDVIPPISTENLQRCKKNLTGDVSRIRIYACDLCPYRTLRSWNMKKHTFVHTGERPHKCSVCGQGFTQKHALKRHLLIHTGQKPFKCDVCSKVYRHKTSLLVHKTAYHK